jgi:hypothetical protein
VKFCHRLFRLDRLSLSLSLSLGSKPLSLSLSLLSLGSKTSEPRAWAWGSKNSLSWALSLWTTLIIIESKLITKCLSIVNALSDHNLQVLTNSYHKNVINIELTQIVMNWKFANESKQLISNRFWCLASI